MKYSTAQEEAIKHIKGPMMVLASPGSGKTMVITHRTKYLIEKAGVLPDQILVITFTKAAASEMKERFYELMQGMKPRVLFGTFHGVFFQILRHAYGYNSNNILKEEEKRRFIKEFLDKEELDLQDEKDMIDCLISEISIVKGNGMQLENYYSSCCSDEVFGRIFSQYEERLIKMSKIDFDDMLIDTYELLTKRSDILNMWQEKFQYILIDEFQDINPIQYKIIELLAKPQNNLFIVGDDDQSIYRFRGAKPELMLGFSKDYPNAKEVSLTWNYRSCPEIVEVADRLISYNKHRFNKKIRTKNPSVEPVHIYKVDTTKEEYEDIVSHIKKYHSQGVEYSNMAVLFRTSIEGRMLLSRLMENAIPFRMKDGIYNIYNHFIAKNIMAYVKLALGHYDRSNLLTIINRPLRYLSRDLFEEKEVDFAKVIDRLGEKDYMIERVELLQDHLIAIRKMTPYAALTFIRRGIGYEDFLQEFAKERHMNPEDLLDIYTEIQEMAKPYSTFGEWFESIEEYGKALEEVKRQNKEQEDCVLLSTMHSAKGLEFDVVFVMNVCEGVIPHKKAIKEEDLEEERRMFYVAITRARKHLYVYTVNKLLGKEKQPSRYIEQMKKMENN